MNQKRIIRFLSYAGIVVRMETNSWEMNDYICNFLSPFFSMPTEVDTLPIATFRIMLSDDLLRGVHQGTVLVRDSHSESGRYRGTEECNNGIRIINLGDTSIAFMDDYIDIVSTSLSSLKKYSRLAIRDVVQKEFERRGGLTLHASSVYDRNGSCICILGSKGSGKTTILLEYLVNRHYRHGGLDRVMIKQENNGIIAYGWPLLYNIGYGTLSRFSELKGLIPAGYTIDDSDWNSDDKLVLEPFELEFEPIVKGPLRMILMPSIDLTIDRSELHEATKEGTRSVLQECVCTPDDPNFIDWHGVVPIDREECVANTAQILDLIAETIPASTLRWGVNIDELP